MWQAVTWTHCQCMSESTVFSGRWNLQGLNLKLNLYCDCNSHQGVVDSWATASPPALHVLHVVSFLLLIFSSPYSQSSLTAPPVLIFVLMSAWIVQRSHLLQTYFGLHANMNDHKTNIKQVVCQFIPNWQTLFVYFLIRWRFQQHNLMYHCLLKPIYCIQPSFQKRWVRMQ